MKRPNSNNPAPKKAETPNTKKPRLDRNLLIDASLKIEGLNLDF